MEDFYYHVNMFQIHIYPSIFIHKVGFTSIYNLEILFHEQSKIENWKSSSSESFMVYFDIMNDIRESLPSVTNEDCILICTHIRVNNSLNL